MMVAFSSDVFEKISTKDYVDRHKKKKTGFYEVKENDHHAYKSISDF